MNAQENEDILFDSHYNYLFIYLGFAAQVLKVCRTLGPTAY